MNKKRHSIWLILFGLGMGILVSCVFLYFKEGSSMQLILSATAIILALGTAVFGIVEMTKTQNREQQIIEDLEYRNQVLLSEVRNYEEKAVKHSEELKESLANESRVLLTKTVQENNERLDNWTEQQALEKAKLSSKLARIEEIRLAVSELIAAFSKVNTLDKDVSILEMEKEIGQLNFCYANFVSFFGEEANLKPVPEFLEEIEHMGIFHISSDVKDILINKQSNVEKNNYILYYVQDIKRIFDEMTYEINEFSHGTEGLKQELTNVTSEMPDEKIESISEVISKLYTLKRRRNSFFNENIAFIPDFMGIYLKIEWDNIMSET